jgi:hypothetical protein
MNIPTALLCTLLLCGVIAYALHSKGDVRAVFKALGVEFSLDAKEKPSASSQVPERKP